MSVGSAGVSASCWIEQRGRLKRASASTYLFLAIMTVLLPGPAAGGAIGLSVRCINVCASCTGAEAEEEAV